MSLDTIPSTEGGKFKAVASGALPNGKPVVVNSDGTVSIISIASDSKTTPTASPLSSSTSYVETSALDPSTGKIMVIYYNGGLAYSVMATISGGSVTFGTSLYLGAPVASTALSYDVSQNKFLICYRGASNYGYARVLSVSGTTITAGTATVFLSAVTSRSTLSYDPVQQRHVNLYMDEGSNVLRAIVFGISGTSVVFGGATQVNAGPNIQGSIAYDPNLQSHVCVYMDYVDGGSYAQTGKSSVLRINPVSNYTVNAIGQFVFAAEGLKNATYDGAGIVYDTVNNVFVIAYVNLGGALKLLTATQTSLGVLSFGTPVVVASSSGMLLTGFNNSMDFDPNSGKVIIAYVQSSANIYVATSKVTGTAVTNITPTFIGSFPSPRFVAFSFNTSTANALVFYQTYDSGTDTKDGGQFLFTPGASSLTAENYIGISSGGAVADTGNATVDIVGTINGNQSGLTAGQKYYVQPGGTLSTTPATPSVLAGTDVSATKLLVKS